MNADELLKILACPKCRGSLRLADGNGGEGFVCDACQAVYPIEDDIPILLIEEAIPLSEWDALDREGRNQCES